MQFYGFVILYPLLTSFEIIVMSNFHLDLQTPDSYLSVLSKQSGAKCRISSAKWLRPGISLLNFLSIMSDLPPTRETETNIYFSILQNFSDLLKSHHIN
jgi:hypothetical protein